MKYIKACERRQWHLRVWPRSVDDAGELHEAPDEAIAVPFRCRSWRHEGECREWKGSQDFARIHQAIASRAFWCHMVVTYRHAAGEPDDAVFRKCVFHWSKLRKRLVRRYGEIKYIQTWEIHRSLWPHVHIAISNRDLQESAVWEPKTNWIRLVMRAARECGFGFVGWLEPLRSQEALSGYLVKIERELTGTGKAYQIPLNAPKNFRRLRASVRLLPPVFKNDKVTGELVKLPCEGDTPQTKAAGTMPAAYADSHVLVSTDQEKVRNSLYSSILE
jgi:hypothetical protein